LIDPHQLSTHLFRELHRHPRMSFLQHCGFIALFALYLAPQLPLLIFLIWVLIAITGGLWQWRISNNFGKDISNTLKSHNLASFKVASFAAGLGLGLTAFLLPELSFSTRLFVILMLSAIAASELLKLSAYPIVYGSYLAGLFLPLLLMLITVNDSPGWELIPPVLIIIGILYYSAIQRRRDLMDDLIARFGLEHDAGEDKLTNLANRRRFDITLEQVWVQARRSGLPLSLLMIDIDYFKKFNDRYGHQAGDKCLTAVARVLANSAKRATDLVARYGGEEFVILLNQTTRNDAYQLAEEIRQRVEDLRIENLDADLGIVSLSLGGVTVYASDDQEASNPLKLADIALYRSKEQGRNQVTWYQAEVFSKANSDETSI